MNRRLAILLAALVLSTSLGYAVDWRHGQVSVGTGSASQIGSATGRTGICWWNNDATNPAFCGKTSAVTSSTGAPFKPGQGICSDGPTAALPVYCIATGGTVVVGFKENVQ